MINPFQDTQLAQKVYSDLTGYDTAAAFTVTGNVAVRVFGIVGDTAITCTSGTTTLSVGTTEAPAAIIAASTIDGAQFAATDVWVDATPTDDVEVLSEGWFIIGGGAAIILTRSVDDITAGNITMYCEWKKLSSDGNVISA